MAKKKDDDLETTLKDAIAAFRKGDYARATDELSAAEGNLSKNSTDKRQLNLLNQYGLASLDAFHQFSETVRLAYVQKCLLDTFNAISVSNWEQAIDSQTPAFAHVYPQTGEPRKIFSEKDFQTMFASRHGSRALFDSLWAVAIDNHFGRNNILPEDEANLVKTDLQAAMAKRTVNNTATRIHEELGHDCTKLRPYELEI